MEVDWLDQMVICAGASAFDTIFRSWLDQIIIRTGASVFDAILRPAARGDHDDAHRQSESLAQAGGQFSAVLAGQVVVEQNNLGGEVLQATVERDPVADAFCLMSDMGKVGQQFFLLGKVIFYNDNARHSFQSWGGVVMSNLRTQLAGRQVFLRRPGLQLRFMLIIGTSALLFVLVTWAVFNSVAERVIERIGARFAEKQVLYDKERTLQPLIREVALAREMADSAVIKHWAKNEQDPRLRAAALMEMEKFGRHFQDGSYFLALAESGHYYFNDASGQYADQPLRYTLDRANPENAWFYATIKSPLDYQINVDPNAKLGVTKVWINVLLRDGGKVLGVVGTGLDLSEFIRNVADINQPGITNLFLDRDGAIQIYRDVQYIDFSSIAKPVGQRRSIDQVLEQPVDRDWVRRAIAQAAADNKAVPIQLVHIKGKKYLAGVAAMPEVGWYDVTLLDLDVLLPQRDFLDMALVIGIAVLGVLLVLTYTLRRLVIRPVAKLTNAAARISQGDFNLESTAQGSGEVGQLESQFNSMSDSIQKSRSWLEGEVVRRTQELSDAKHLLEISLKQEKEGRLAQTNLLALMAHEVRSPVAVIGNTAQMLNALASTEKPDWLPRLEKIMAAVRQLAQLMDDVLAEDRIALKNSVLERQSGNLNVFCEALCIRQMARHKRTIIFEPCAEDLSLDMDWHLIDVAVSNLVDNAIKYSPADSVITLRVVHGQDGVSIDVHNHGQAISREMQSRIFEKFARGQAEDDGRGVGLGLYLVRWIAELHGGYADVVSNDEGNTFRLIFD